MIAIENILKNLLIDWSYDGGDILEYRHSRRFVSGIRFSSRSIAVLAFVIGTLFSITNAKAFQSGDESMPEASSTASKSSGSGVAVPANEAPADTPEQKTFLKWLIDASGPFGACIFVESFIMVTLMIMCILQFRRENFLPPELIEELEAKLTAGDYKGAFEAAKQDESLLARLLVAGMTKVQKGPEAAEKAITDLGNGENMAMEHRLSWLALIATTGPMFGLLGTVQGMVQAFEKIASSNTTPKPSELAEGIQLALVTTLEGLVIAIPAMVAYSLLRNRLMRLMFDVGLLVEQLMGRIQSRPTPPATPAAAI